MATLAELTVIVTDRLGQRGDLDEMVQRELRQAQRLWEKTPPYPWWLARAWAPAVSTQVTVLPDAFIEFMDDGVFLVGVYGETPYTEPLKLAGAHLEHAYLGQDKASGQPVNFTLVGTELYMLPTPNKIYQIASIVYWKQSILLTPTSSNRWSDRGEDMLVAEAGYQVARSLRDAEATQRFGLDRSDARARMRIENTSRLESMRQAVIMAGEDALL